MNEMATDFLAGPFPWIIGFGFAFVLVLLTSFIFLKAKKKPIKNYDSYILSLGGIENIRSVSYKGSRLSIVLKNEELVNNQLLKELGVFSIIHITGKITLLIGAESENIAKFIQSKINQ
jgi:phosphotransferase system IIB component